MGRRLGLIAALAVALAATGCQARRDPSSAALTSGNRPLGALHASVTLEDLARGASLVVAGVVTGDPVERAVAENDVPADLRDSSLYRDGRFEEATVRVEEALKGPAEAGATIVVRTVVSWPGGSAEHDLELGRLRAGERVLLFLKRDDGYLRGWTYWGGFQGRWRWEDGVVRPLLDTGDPVEDDDAFARIRAAAANGSG